MPQYGKSFTEVESDEKEALRESDKLYDDMAKDSDSYYQAQIDASRQWAEQQKQQQQEKTDLAISQINQQKEWAQKDYIKEQSGAYTDWQKESNQYGIKAEEQAASGLSNSGYSESSKTSMYVAYQNRIATAREAHTRAVVNYDMAIKEAQLQNSSILAEIAYNALQTELTLSLEGFQYKNTLLLEKAAAQKELKSFYYQQWQDVLNQINTERAYDEQKRQFEAEMDFSEKQLEENKRQFEENLNFDKEQFTWQKEQAAKTSSSSGGGGSEEQKKVNKSTGVANKNITKKAIEVDDIKAASFKGTTYEEANAYLESMGVKDFNLMPKAEWQMKKGAYNRNGIGGYEVSANKTYADYLKTAVAYAVENK